MKKLLLYFCAFVFICFILPALLTKHNTAVTASKEDEKNEEQQEIATPEELAKYDYKKYGIIKLLHKKTEQ